MQIFGITENLDIYIASNTINLIIIGVSTGALNYAITPIFLKYYKNRRLKTFQNLANSLVNILLIIFVFLAVIQSYFSQEITSIIFPGYIDKQNVLLSEMFAMQAFISIFSILIGVLNAINYTFNKLYRTVLVPIVSSSLQILFVYFTYKDLGIFSLVYALGLNQLIIFIILGSFYFKFYQFKIKSNKVLKKSLSKMYPLIISSTFSKSDVLVDRYFASMLMAGSISILYYGQLIIGVITTIVNNGISLVSLRKFSSIENNAQEFNEYFINLYRIMLIVTMFFVIQIVISSDYLLSEFLSGDKFSPKKLNILYIIILSFLGVFVGGILTSVLVNAFYAKGETVLISRMSIKLHIIGIVFKIIFYKLYGFYALAVVMSVKSLVNSVLLVYLYNIKIYRIKFRSFLYLFINVVAFSTLIIVTSLYFKYLDINIFLIMLFSSLTYILYYFNYIKKMQRTSQSIHSQ